MRKEEYPPEKSYIPASLKKVLRQCQEFLFLTWTNESQPKRHSFTFLVFLHFKLTFSKVHSAYSLDVSFLAALIPLDIHC